ncbi:MAG: N-acetyltransferase [Terriglobia bacterium]
MKTEFRKVGLPKELRSLVSFDGKVFAAPDRFPASDWMEYESWWMLVRGVKVGCCAFAKDHPRKGWLYIASTAIARRHQGRGFGTILKSWEIAYAKFHGFRRVVTHSRRSNAAMIALNRKAGFQVVREIGHYYAEPDESAVVMELKL